MAGAAPVFAMVQINAPGIEPPELGAGRAGSVTRRRHLGAGIDRVAQGLGRAPATPLQQEIIATPEFTGLGVEVQKGRLALQIKPVIPIADIAFELRRVAGLVIDHLVRAGLAPLARDLHIPEQRGDPVCHQIGLIGADHGLVRFQPRLDHGPGRDDQRFRAKQPRRRRARREARQQPRQQPAPARGGGQPAVNRLCMLMYHPGAKIA